MLANRFSATWMEARISRAGRQSGFQTGGVSRFGFDSHDCYVFCPEGPATEKINPDRKFQRQCFYLRGPPGVHQKGSIEKVKPGSTEGCDQISSMPRPSAFCWDCPIFRDSPDLFGHCPGLPHRNVLRWRSAETQRTPRHGHVGFGAHRGVARKAPCAVGGSCRNVSHCRRLLSPGHHQGLSQKNGKPPSSDSQFLTVQPCRGRNQEPKSLPILS